MSKLLLEIPEDVTDALRLPPAERDRELRTELALALYQRQVLSGGMARKLSGLTRWEFEHLLGQRRVVRHYDGDDLSEDLRYGQGR
jgi:predicted HTH domain antitoxin